MLRAAALAAANDTVIDRSSLERLAAEAPPLPDPWPAEARTRLAELLLAGPPAVGIIEALDQRGLWTRVLPEWEPTRLASAAQRLPHLHRRPAPGGGRRRRGRAGRAGSTVPTCW